MIVIGFDVGKKGGYAIFDNGKLVDAGKFLQLGDNIDVSHIVGKMLDYNVDHAFIEDVHSIYGTSAKSNFQFGRSLGILEGAVQACGVPYQKVAPKVWQKFVWLKKDEVFKGTKKDTKKTSINSMVRIFGEEVKMFTIPARCRSHQDGIVDSILIGYYGSIKLNKS